MSFDDEQIESMVEYIIGIHDDKTIPRADLATLTVQRNGVVYRIRVPGKFYMRSWIRMHKSNKMIKETKDGRTRKD